jgi:hypothetical protein
MEASFTCDAYVGLAAVAADEWADAPDVAAYVSNAWDTRYSWDGVDTPHEVRLLVDFDVLTENESDPNIDGYYSSGYQTGWFRLELATAQHIAIPQADGMWVALYLDDGGLTRLYSSQYSSGPYFDQLLFYPPYWDGAFRPSPSGGDPAESVFLPTGTYYLEYGSGGPGQNSGVLPAYLSVYGWQGFTANAVVTDEDGSFSTDAVVGGDYLLVDHWQDAPDYFTSDTGVAHVATGVLALFDTVRDGPWRGIANRSPDAVQVNDSDGTPIFWGLANDPLWYHISYIRLRIPREGAWIRLRVDGSVTQNYGFVIRTAHLDDTYEIGPAIFRYAVTPQDVYENWVDHYQHLGQQHLSEGWNWVDPPGEWVPYSVEFDVPLGWERLLLEGHNEAEQYYPDTGRSQTGTNIHADGSVDYWIELGFYTHYSESEPSIASIEWEVFTPPSFTADAVITQHVIVANAIVKRTMSGGGRSWTENADIVKNFRVWGNFYLFAIRRKEREGVFSADAVSGHIFKLDAITRREVRTPFYADAVLNRGGNIAADAWIVIQPNVALSFSASAVVHVPGRILADALVRVERTESFRAKAFIWGEMKQGFGAWAWVIGTPGSFTADAQTSTPSTGSGTFTAEAEVSIVYRLHEFSADAVSLSAGRNDFYGEAFIGDRYWFIAEAIIAISRSFTADACLATAPFYPSFTAWAEIAIPRSFTAGACLAGRFTADAIVGQAYGTYSASAWVQREQIGEFEPISIIRRADMPGSFTVEAWLAGVFSADALIVTRAGGVHAFTVGAYIRRWLPGPNPPPPGIDDSRYQAKNVRITVDGSDITDDVLWNECNFTQTARVMPGTFSVGLLGSHRGHEGQKLELFIDGQAVFAGYVTTTESSFVFPSVLEGDDTPVTKTTLSGPDVNVILDRYLIYDPLKNPENDTKGINNPWYGTPGFNPGKTDAFLVAWYTGKWSKAKETGLDYTGNVDVCGVVNPNVVGRIMDWNGVSLRAAYQQWSRVTSAIFWVDPYMSLHWHSRFEVSAPFAIGDGEEYVNGRDLSGRTSIERQVSDTIVWGTLMSEKDPQQVDRVSYIREKSDEGGAGFQLGEWHADVHKTTSLKVRAQTIIARYKKPLDMVTISIFEPGIQAGMVVELLLGSHGGSYILPVKSLSITFEGMHTQRSGYPRFTLDCGIDPEDPWQVFDPLPWPEIDIPHTQSPQVGFWNGGGKFDLNRRYGPYTHFITAETGPLVIRNHSEDEWRYRERWPAWDPYAFEGWYPARVEKASISGPGYWEFHDIYLGNLAASSGHLVMLWYPIEEPIGFDVGNTGWRTFWGFPDFKEPERSYVGVGDIPFIVEQPVPGIFSARPEAPPTDYEGGSLVDINWEAEYVFEFTEGPDENLLFDVIAEGTCFTPYFHEFDPSILDGLGTGGWKMRDIAQRWNLCRSIKGVGPEAMELISWLAYEWGGTLPDEYEIGTDLLWAGRAMPQDPMYGDPPHKYSWIPRDDDGKAIVPSDIRVLGNGFYGKGKRYRVKFQSLANLGDTYQDRYGRAAETPQRIQVDRSKVWLDGTVEPPCWMTVTRQEYWSPPVPPIAFFFSLGWAYDGDPRPYAAREVRVHEFKIRSVLPDEIETEPSTGADIGWGTEMPAYLGDRIFETTRPYWGHSMKVYWHGERLIYGRDWTFVVYATKTNENGVESDLPQDETGLYPDTGGLTPEELATVKIKPLTQFKVFDGRDLSATLTTCGELDPSVRCSYLSRTGDFESMPGHPRDTRTSTNPDHITFFDIPGRR